MQIKFIEADENLKNILKSDIIYIVQYVGCAMLIIAYQGVVKLYNKGENKMRKDMLYIQLKRDNAGKLTTKGWEKVLEGYTSDDLEKIVTSVDGCNDVIPCPVIERDSSGKITKWAVPVPY